MHWIFKITLGFVGFFIAFALFMYSIIEMGGEVVTLIKPTDDNKTSSARIWIVDDGEHAWIEHGEPSSFWIRQLAANPEVNLTRGGKTRTYGAKPDVESHDLIHRLLQEKYGFADTVVRLFIGEADRCAGLPVRLTLSSQP